MTQTQQQQQTNSPFMTAPHDVYSSWSTTSSSRAAAALVPCHAVGEYDVLSGRGGATNNHSGNKRFRALVSTFRAEYLQARKKDKVLIARRIVDAIRQQGGRFLKRYDNNEEGNVNNNTNNNNNSNNSNNTIVWIDVGDKRATEKTSQALREGLDVRNHTIRGGNGGQQQQQQQQRRRRQGATTATKKQPGHVRRESDSTTSSSWSSSYYSSPTKHHHPATNYFDHHHLHHHHVVIGDVSVMTAAAAMVPTFAPGSPAVVSLPGGDFATNSAATTAATNRIIPELFLPHPGTAAANDNNNNNTIIYPERKISQSDCDAVVAL